MHSSVTYASFAYHSVKNWVGAFKENQMRNHEWCIEAKFNKHLACLEKFIWKSEFFHSIYLLLCWMPKAHLHVMYVFLVFGISDKFWYNQMFWCLAYSRQNVIYVFRQHIRQSNNSFVKWIVIYSDFDIFHDKQKCTLKKNRL